MVGVGMGEDNGVLVMTFTLNEHCDSDSKSSS